MAKKKAVEVVAPEVAAPIALEPNVSATSVFAWYNEVAAVMQGKFSDNFIVSKAKLAFGQTFDGSRYADIDGSLKDRVVNVWDSQK